MLEFSDAPYQFYPPKPNPVVAWLARQVNRHFALPGPNHRIGSIRLSGGEAVRELSAKGERMLFLPNHPTHSDPQAISEAYRRMRVQSCFMCAYDIFVSSQLRAWVIQRVGGFSVDREANDSRAMKTALEILREGRFPLTIFPEGNVYLRNDRVMPFMEGAAFMALKVQHDLGAETPLWVVPVSLKYTHAGEVDEKLWNRLETLAAEAGVTLDPTLPAATLLAQTGTILMHRKLRDMGLSHGEKGGGGATESAHSEIEEVVTALIASLEEKLALVAAKTEAALKDRVRKIRSAIHQKRLKAYENEQAEPGDRLASEAMLALRLTNYLEPYVAENPTVDRVAELVESIAEDYASRIQAKLGKREAQIHFGAPINLIERLEEYQTGARAAVRRLTAECEGAVQAGLDELNARNGHTGGQLWKAPAVVSGAASSELAAA